MSKKNEEREELESSASNNAGKEFKPLPPKQPESVRRKKARARTLAVFGMSSALLMLLIIIALLGQNNGNFTIKIEKAQFHLALGSTLTNNKGDADVKDGKAVLMAEGFKAAAPMKADNLPDADILDGDITDSTLEVVNRRPANLDAQFGVDADYSYKYTFYLQNTSFTEVGHINYYINFVDIVEPSNFQNTGPLEDFVRVRVYDTVFTGTTISHNLVGTYARESHRAFPDNGNEFITKNAVKDENKGKCTNFINDHTGNPRDMVVMTNTVDIQPREVRRYSVIIWLEGHDPDCDGENPEGAKLTLGMGFTTDDLNSSWISSSTTTSDSTSYVESN
ncbi:MAG: hypothetical protein MJ228_04075 [Bacilli bacterium]|nr:hypothetical protein [Bacilli bacterium]